MTVQFKFGDYYFYLDDNPERYEESQDFRMTEIIIPGKDGVVVPQDVVPKAAKVIGPIPFSLSESSPELLRTALDELYNVVLNGEEENLYLYDDRYIPARVKSSGMVMGPGMLSAFGWITFLAPDPYWISTTLSQDSSYTDNAIGITNGGNADAYPIITINNTSGAALTSVTLTNSTGSDTFTWSGSLPNGGVLEVDMGGETIEEDGVETFSGLGGDWWALQPGLNTLSLSSTPTGASVQLAWRNRWK